MGAEATCTVTVGRRKDAGKALLETDALIFRGRDLRLSIPYKKVSSADAKDGVLRVTYPDGVAAFNLGVVSVKWAKKILNPPTRADKLGVKQGERVLLIGIDDEELVRELEERGASVARRMSGDADVIFYAANNRAALARLSSLRSRLTPAGAIWIIRPKGTAAITESEVMTAARAAGLVDVKVARYSDTHTAEKYVIPVRLR
jgi:hypothetical protein